MYVETGFVRVRMRVFLRWARVWLVLGLLLGVGALAEGGLDVTFSISPAEMVGPSDATMTFVISNNTGADVKNIYLTSADGTLSEPVGQLGAGESQTLVRPHAVTQEELDDGCVRYVLSHDAPDGEKVTHALSAAVTKGDARPEVDFTRQVSSRYVPAGSQLTITYRVTNNGNVPVSAIYVRDALGDFTGRLEQLPIGSTRNFISRVTVNMECQSEASLELGRSAFDPDRADAVLMLSNRGNDDYEDVTVLDDVYGGVIADGIRLPKGGAPVEVAFTYPVRGAGEYRWRVTGVSQAGESVDFVTDTRVLTDDQPERTVELRMTAEARTPRISRPGNVTFDITVTNTGTAAAKGLSLYEAERGTAREVTVLPTGEPSRFSVTYEVRQDGQYTFCLNYLDAEGHTRTVSAEPVEVVVTPGGEPPEPLDSERMQLEGTSVKLSNRSTFTILLIVASAALVSMFTLLLVTSLRARQDRRRAAQKRRGKGRSDGKRASKKRKGA